MLYELNTHFVQISEVVSTVGGREKSVIESALDIQLGRGTRPDSSASFDARQVKENLSPKDE